MGVTREQVLSLKRAFEAGATVEEASELVTEHMVRPITLRARRKKSEIRLSNCSPPRKGSVTIMLLLPSSGPDYEESIKLLAGQVMPALSRHAD